MTAVFLKIVWLATCLWQPITSANISGTWQAEKVVYIDQEPVVQKEEQLLVWQFTDDGKCFDHIHQSETRYRIWKDQLNLDGYTCTIEKLTKQQLVIRENKQFFVRRIYFKRINQ